MFNIVTRAFFFRSCTFSFYFLIRFIKYKIFISRDLQKSYLDVLTWLVRMESNVTTDDANANALMNDVLKKTSLLIGVCDYQ